MTRCHCICDLKLTNQSKTEDVFGLPPVATSSQQKALSEMSRDEPAAFVERTKRKSTKWRRTCVARKGRVSLSSVRWALLQMRSSASAIGTDFTFTVTSMLASSPASPQ